MRLSLAFSAIVFLAFLVSTLLIGIGVRRASEAGIRQDLTIEFDAIATELRQEGLEAAIAAIAARADPSGAVQYWLAGPDGEPRAGNLPALGGANGWRQVTLEGTGSKPADSRRLLVRTGDLGAAGRLSVAGDLRRSEALKGEITRILIIVGALALLASLVAGSFVTRHALSRIDRLHAVLERISTGDLTARYVAAGGDNDLDEIGSAVNLMLERIETLVAGIRRTSRDIAHDLRTPIAHLRQSLEELESAVTPEQRQTAIERAQGKAASVLRTFDAILRLGEIETATSMSRFESVQLSSTVAKVIDAYRPDIEESGRSVELGPLDEGVVRGDADLIMQAEANLLENAMRHTPAGTIITVSCVRDAGQMVIEVRDDGPGIEEAYRIKVLEPFARLDASRSTPGSGLGLSLVAAIARLHGAELELSDAHPGLAAALRFRNANR